MVLYFINVCTVLYQWTVCYVGTLSNDILKHAYGHVFIINFLKIFRHANSSLSKLCFWKNRQFGIVLFFPQLLLKTDSLFWIFSFLRFFRISLSIIALNSWIVPLYISISSIILPNFCLHFLTVRYVFFHCSVLTVIPVNFSEHTQFSTLSPRLEITRAAATTTIVNQQHPFSPVFPATPRAIHGYPDQLVFARNAMSAIEEGFPFSGISHRVSERNIHGPACSVAQIVSNLHRNAASFCNRLIESYRYAFARFEIHVGFYVNGIPDRL